MTEVSVSKKIQIPAAAAWGNLSSFRGIEHISPIERSITEGHGQGATRTCYMPDGAAISEVMSKMSDETMEMEYKILEGPFPIESYVSSIKVNARSDDQCEVTWSCNFESDAAVEQDMVKLFSGFYNVIIDNLEASLKA